MTKLESRAEQVSELEEELKVKAVEVEEKKAAADAMIPKLEAEKDKATDEAERANVIASEATKKESNVTAMKTSIEEDLAAAKPALVAAATALDSVNKKDLGELKNLDVTGACIYLLQGRRLVEGVAGHDEGRERLPRDPPSPPPSPTPHRPHNRRRRPHRPHFRRHLHLLLRRHRLLLLLRHLCRYLLSSSVAAVSITAGGRRWLTAAKAQRRSRRCCDLPGTSCAQELESRPLPDHTLVRRVKVALANICIRRNRHCHPLRAPLPSLPSPLSTLSSLPWCPSWPLPSWRRCNSLSHHPPPRHHVCLPPSLHCPWPLL